jgi:uncharacterized protein (DUF1330 family)
MGILVVLMAGVPRGLRPCIGLIFQLTDAFPGRGRPATRVAALAHTRSSLAACDIGSPAAVWTGGVMAGYFVANYTITNQANYQEYLAAVGPILRAHGAENIVIDRDSELLEGSAGQVTVVLRFATKAAAKAWYESSEYRVIRHLRTDNTEGIGSSRRGNSLAPGRAPRHQVHDRHGPGCFLPGRTRKTAATNTPRQRPCRQGRTCQVWQPLPRADSARRAEVSIPAVSVRGLSGSACAALRSLCVIAAGQHERCRVAGRSARHPCLACCLRV